MEKPLNTEEIKERIRYAISSMAATSSWNEFEKLCVEFARRNIFENVAPSTGGGVGDGGEDGYTFTVYKNGEPSEKVSVACSLKQDFKTKVKGDLKSIDANKPEVKNVCFFSGVNISKSNKDTLEKEAKDNYSIKLEIYDLNFLSFQLALFKHSELVETYLHIPSNIYPIPENDDSTEDWYTKFKNKYTNKKIENLQHFSEAKVSIRESVAQGNDKDVSFWLNKLKEFNTENLGSYHQSKVQYEVAWATLRGLDDLEGFKNLAIQYINSFEFNSDVASLEDALCLVQYSIAVFFQGIKFPERFLSTFKGKIDNKIEELLQNSGLLTKGHLLYLKMFSKQGNVTPDITSDNKKFTERLDDYFMSLDELLNEIEAHPYFSSKKVYDVFKVMYDLFYNKSKDKFDNFMSRIEQLLESQEGKGGTGELIRDRMIKSMDNEDYYSVIKDGHKLKINWLQYDAVYGSSLAMALIGDAYKHLNLVYASKYYHMLASYICFEADGEWIKEKALNHICSVASLEYQNGNWFKYFDLLNTYFYIHYGFKQTPINLKNNNELAMIFHAQMIRLLASFDEVYDASIVQVIKNLHCDEELKEMIISGTLELAKNKKTLSEYWQDYENSFLGRPFKDASFCFEISFFVSGILWKIRSENKNHNLMLVEEFASILQIIMTELKDTDILHFKTDVIINIIPTKKDMEVIEKGSNHEFEYDLHIPDVDIKLDPQEYLTSAFSILVTILSKCSLATEDDFLAVVENILKKGVMDKLGFIKLYRDVYLGMHGGEKDSISALDKKLNTFNEAHAFKNNNIVDIFKYDELANNYDEIQIQDDIKRRYDNTLILLRPTLETLNSNKVFVNAISRLQAKGYKDWEILSSLANMFMNYKVTQKLIADGVMLVGGKINPSYSQPETMDLMRKKMLDIRDNPEKYNSPIQNMNKWFNEDHLYEAIDMNSIYILQSLNLHSKTKLPKFKAIRDFLNTRYRLNELDVEHENILQT